jgi:polygalacturonase
VASYGAVAGDGRDDAAAINGALDAAGEGDTVQIGKGTWEIGSTILARSDVNAHGGGARTRPN